MPHTPVPASPTSSPRHAATPAFRATTRDDGRKVAWVHVTGALDIAAAPLLQQTLREALGRSRLVVVDLRELTRVDSSGVGAIVKASRAGRRAGRRLILIRGLTQVDRLLSMTGATDAVEIVDLLSGEPAVQALLHIARHDRAALRQRASAVGRVRTLIGRNQISRGVDVLVARRTASDFIDS